MHILPILAAILPDTGAPANPAALAQTGLEFFGTWISRIGGLVAFIGAIKFALSIKSDETRDQLPALLTMVSGFMIQAAIANLGIFELATTNAETIFQNILLFIGRWTRRVGAAGTLVGAVMFGFSIKDNNAVGKSLHSKHSLPVQSWCLCRASCIHLYNQQKVETTKA